jgi:hypothetical protein
MSYPFDTTRSLSAEARPLLFRQQHSLSLSPQKVTRSICVPRGPRRPVPFAAASCARSKDCVTAKGARADVDRAVLRACDPPPRPRSARRKSSSRWKLIGPFYWNYSTVPTHRRIIRCWSLASKTSLVASTRPSDELLQTRQFIRCYCMNLGASLCCLNFGHRIDRQFLPMDRRFFRRYYLLFFFSATRPTLLEIKWTVGSSDGALVFTQCTNSSDHCTDACYLGTVGSSDSVLSFPFLSRFWPLKNRLSSQFGMWYFGILGT